MISAALAGFTVAGESATPSRSSGELTRGSATSHLEVMRVRLLDARHAQKPRKQREAIASAIDFKGGFVLAIYENGEDRLFGCDALTSFSIFRNLEQVDLALEIGALEGGRAGKERVEDAALYARPIADLVANCPQADEGARVIAAEIASRSVDLVEQSRKGKLTPKELKKAIKRLAAIKQRLLASQRIGDCDASRIYTLVKEIDVPLERANEIDELQHDFAFDRRRKLVDDAIPHAEKLVEMWRECGVPDCADSRDNDGDGLIDEVDPGCRTGASGDYEGRDRSEQDSGPVNDCTGLELGKPITSVFGVTSSGSRILRFNLRSDGTRVFERQSDAADFASGGPVALDTAVCGRGTSATLESWSVQGLTVGMTLKVVKDEAEVTPAAKRIVVAADTR